MGQTQIEQEGANRRNVQSIQGQKDVAQLQAENQERLAKLRIEAEKSLAAFNLAGQAAASGDPIAQGGMYNFMLGNKEFFKDLVVPGDAAETVERGTKLANAKIDLVKNQAKHAEVEAKLKEPLAKIHEKIAKGGKLTEDEKIVAGLKKPMTALESLQFSEVAKLTKDPKMASAYTAALMTHGNPLGMLAYSMLAQGKPLDEVTAIFKGVDKDSLDDIMTLGKIMLSDPTGQAAKDPVFQATMQFTLKKLLTKLGAKDPEIQNILKAGDSDMKKLNEIFRKALEEKYGLGEGQVGVAH
jgi:hypothetical protein